jgi:peroxiredoxin
MSEQQKKIGLWFLIILAAIFFVLMAVWIAAKRQSANNPPTEKPIQAENVTQAEKQTAENKTLSPEKIIKDTDLPQKSLAEIIEARKSWDPTLMSWFNREAPDFTMADINGKTHKLSDYRGKNVILIFWATWCGPCVMEVPHLIALRNVLGEDKLAILAITQITSNNTSEMVKQFVKEQKVNYTVVPADVSTMPSPFNNINFLPSSFFIDPNGKIKLAAVGGVPFGEMKAIVLVKTH